MVSNALLVMMTLSVLCQACRGTLYALSRDESLQYSYSTGVISLSAELIKLFISFSTFKWKERRNPSIRRSFGLKELFLLLIPSILVVLSGSIYYSLQRLFEDELVIQVIHCPAD